MNNIELIFRISGAVGWGVLAGLAVYIAPKWTYIEKLHWLRFAFIAGIAVALIML